MGGELQQADRRSGLIHRVLVHQVLAPLLGSTVAVAYATGRWDLSALGTGLAITGVLALIARLDRVFIHPLVQRKCPGSPAR